MKKVISIILVLTLAMITMIGCNDNGRTVENTEQTISITDAVGRTVSVPQNPQRIVCLNSDLLELIIILGAKNRVVGIDSYTKSGGSWVAEKYSDMANLPCPQISNEINKEEMLNINADIIITTIFGQIAYEEVLKIEEYVDAPIVVFSFEHLETYFSEMENMSKILNTENRYNVIKEKCDELLNSVSKVVSTLTDNEKVSVYHALWEPYITFGKNIFEEEQIVTAGGKCVTSELDGFGISVTAEQILNWNPDCFVLVYECSLDTVKNDQKLSSLNAIENNKIYQHPESGWAFLSPRSILTIKWLSINFYPEKYQEVNFDTEIDDFYKMLYGFGYQK